MKKKIILLGIFLFFCGQALAFVYQLPILSKSEIVKLTDEKLLDTYIDAVVEVQASGTFHQTSGFKPSDYESYKKLLRYKILLKQEISKRGLDAPDVGSVTTLKPAQ